MLRSRMRIVACILGMLVLPIGYLNAKPLYDYQKIKENSSGKPARMLDSIKYEKIIAHGFDSGLNTRCLMVIGDDGKQYIIRQNGDLIERFAVTDISVTGTKEFVMFGRSIASVTPVSNILNICRIDTNGVVQDVGKFDLEIKDANHTMITPAAFIDETRILLLLFSMSRGGSFVYRIFDLPTGKLLSMEAAFRYPVSNSTNEVKANRILIIESQVDVKPSWHNRLYVLNSKDLSKKMVIPSMMINEKNQIMWLGSNELCFATCDGGMDYITGLWKVNMSSAKQTQIFDFKGMRAMRCIPLSADDRYVVSEVVNGRKILYRVDASHLVKSKLLELNPNDVTEVIGNRNLLVISRKTKEFRLYQID